MRAMLGVAACQPLIGMMPGSASSVVRVGTPHAATWCRPDPCPCCTAQAAQDTPAQVQLLQLLHTTAAASSSSLAAVAGHSGLLQRLCQLVAQAHSSRQDAASSDRKAGSATAATAAAAAADLLQLLAATADSRQQLAGVLCGNSLQLVGCWLEALPQQAPALQVRPSLLHPTSLACILCRHQSPH